MKKKINVRLLGIATLGIISTLVLCVIIFYGIFKEQVTEDMKIYTHLLKGIVTTEDKVDQELSGQLKDLRITIIEADGTVIFDSVANTREMEDHSDRPEIQAALQNGEGHAVRRSETMDKNTYYYAIRLDNQRILRLAKEANNIFSIFKSALPMFVVLFAALFVLCAILAHFLTKTLIAPIEQMAMNKEEDKEIVAYPELVPFIQTIRDQHQDILKNAQIRQDFTANVSHELKTPLTSISGYSELIENGMATEKDVARFAREIHRSSNRLLTLINDIIRLSELDVTEPDFIVEKLDLYHMAQNCVNMLQVNAEKHGVTIMFSGQGCEIEANKEMMEEVLYNLCDNAIRYNNKGGTVEVSTKVETFSRAELQKYGESFINSKNKVVVLSVKDTGIGIFKEHQERIFERFYRVDKSRSKSTGGTGLGLAIVKHIVAKHDAEMELISEKGKGTEIRIFFPWKL